MANKQILSIVAASILAASFTLTGCGSSSSSNSGSSSVAPTSSDAAVSSEASTSSEATTEPISVTAFRLLEANVTKGGVENSIANATQYEFPEGTTGALATMGGAYDVNGDNNATSDDAKAPALAGPATFSNINALSTLEAQGVSIDDINAFYGISLETTDIAIDSTDVPVYAANAKALLRLAGYPGDGVATSSEGSDSSEGTSSSTDSSNPYPASILRGSPYPEEPSSAAEVSSEASTSSESTDTDTAYADIDACTDAACIDGIVGSKLISLKGSYDANPSSDDATSSDAASSEEETSSEAASSDASNPYPAPAL